MHIFFTYWSVKIENLNEPTLKLKQQKNEVLLAYYETD
jgi:hypothetical protein